MSKYFDYSLAAHIGPVKVKELKGLPTVLLDRDPLKMHKSEFTRYLRAAIEDGVNEQQLIALIEQWKLEARRINRERRKLKELHSINRSDAKHHATAVR